eukprot:5930102-Pyramimonas_sp.AAC.1
MRKWLDARILRESSGPGQLPFGTPEARTKQDPQPMLQMLRGCHSGPRHARSFLRGLQKSPRAFP